MGTAYIARRVVVTPEMAADLERRAAEGERIRAAIDRRRRKRAFGCGCAACTKEKTMAFRKHARGSDDDRRQIIADLISNDDSPFTPADMDALGMMTEASLRAMRDDFLPKKAKAQDDEGEEDDEGITRENIVSLVANAVSAALAGLGIKTNAPPRSSWTKDDERRAQVEKSARDLLRGLGIAKPSEAQVRDMVDTIIAKLDSDDGAGPGTSGSVMNTAVTAEELAAEAELRGNSEKARRLRTMAANQRAQDRAAGVANSLAYRPQLRPVTNAAEDDDVKAMSEFNSDAAIARALANKRKEG
jgi:hypothetical protein